MTTYIVQTGKLRAEVRACGPKEAAVAAFKAWKQEAEEEALACGSSVCELRAGPATRISVPGQPKDEDWYVRSDAMMSLAGFPMEDLEEELRK